MAQMQALLKIKADVEGEGKINALLLSTYKRHVFNTAIGT